MNERRTDTEKESVNMHLAAKKIGAQIRALEKEAAFIAVSLALAISYYIDPLVDTYLTKWDRTFSTAMQYGISIDSRTGNFYTLFFLVIPAITIALLAAFSLLFKHRPSYKDTFCRLSIFLALATLVSYISRYAAGSNQAYPDAIRINSNPMLQCLLAFYAVLFVIALADRREKLTYNDATLLLLVFVVSIVSSSMLFHAEGLLTYIIISAAALVILMAVTLLAPGGETVYPSLKKFMLILLWMPALMRFSLEVIYVLTEKGHAIANYYTIMICVASAFIVLDLLVVLLTRNKRTKLTVFGYVGAIVSIAIIVHISYVYQNTIAHQNMPNVYELGNCAVAVDTYLYGKLPVIDYFSAHVLSDIWTQLLSAFVHGNVMGIFGNTYFGLSTVASYVILFFIIKQLFDEHTAALYVLLFPGALASVKWKSICSIAVAMLLYICRKKTYRAYIAFWVCALICAFYNYGDGVPLGVACIVSYLLLCAFQKNWKDIRRFVLCGAGCGAVVLVFYGIYAAATGIPVLGRIKEWVSVTLFSNSTWATVIFGDPASFDFLLSYFIAPMTAVVLLAAVIIKYIRGKKEPAITALTAAFAIAELALITRTIVFHNLTICSGSTGVLLNFIHWTVAMYVLYTVTIKGRSETVRILAFSGTMMAVILIGATAVTHIWPTADSVLVSCGLKAAQTWDLQDDNTSNIGQERIVYAEDTKQFIGKFDTVFDALLTEDQTFVDFANVTSLYLFTGRPRPCYVGQTPSLLTDLYSQECYLNEIAEYDCPLAVLGTTETPYVQQMSDIPHNIRYYKIAEYIYRHYRPLVKFDEFVIWCENDKYDAYKATLSSLGLEGMGYTLVDYGYDFTTVSIDGNGAEQVNFMPYHNYDLQLIPYVWANYDDYGAIRNEVITELSPTAENVYNFEGSQQVLTDKGNYVAFEATNNTGEAHAISMLSFDSTNTGAEMQYVMQVKPGTSQYLVRVSQDYFWDIFNIDTILFGIYDDITVSNVRILGGD